MKKEKKNCFLFILNKVFCNIAFFKVFLFFVVRLFDLPPFTIFASSFLHILLRILFITFFLVKHSIFYTSVSIENNLSVWLLSILYQTDNDSCTFTVFFELFSFILLIPFQCFFLLLLIYIVIFINTFHILIIHVLSCFCCLFYSFHNRFEHPCQAVGCIELFDNFFHVRWKSYSWFWRQLWYVTSAIDSLSKTNYLLAMSTDEGKL